MPILLGSQLGRSTSNARTLAGSCTTERSDSSAGGARPRACSASEEKAAAGPGEAMLEPLAGLDSFLAVGAA